MYTLEIREIQMEVPDRQPAMQTVSMDQGSQGPEGISAALISALGTEVCLDTSGNFALSTRGLAVRRSDGRFVTKESSDDQLTDVTDLLLPGVDNFIFRVRVEALKRGDLIVISDAPFSARYILAQECGCQPVVLDSDSGDIAELTSDQMMPPDGFVRAASLLDFLKPNSDGIDWTKDDPQLRKGGEVTMAREQFERPESGEGLDLDDLLLLSILTGQQQGQNAAPNLLNTLILSKVLGRHRGGFRNLLLVSMLANVSTGPTPTGMQALNANSLPLLLALTLSRHDEDDFRRRRGWEEKEGSESAAKAQRS